jgi:hypothetical protein
MPRLYVEIFEKRSIFESGKILSEGGNILLEVGVIG